MTAIFINNRLNAFYFTKNDNSLIFHEYINKYIILFIFSNEKLQVFKKNFYESND
jgi:hypothetical protein